MPTLEESDATGRSQYELTLVGVPILALTPRALLGERQQHFEAGMGDFVTGPCDPRPPISNMRQPLEHARGVPIPMVVHQIESVPRAADWPVMSSIDSSVLPQLFGDESSLFISLLVRVLREFSVFEVPCALSADNRAGRKALQLRAHKLKGSAGVIGATRLRRLAGAIEKALIEDRPSELVERLLKQLASALVTLRAESVPLLRSQLPDVTSGSSAGGVGVNHGMEAVEELRGLLDHHNLAAVDAFNALAPRLSAVLSPARLGRLRDAIEDLDFPLGAQLLREARLQEAVSVADG